MSLIDEALKRAEKEGQRGRRQDAPQPPLSPEPPEAPATPDAGDADSHPSPWRTPLLLAILAVLLLAAGFFGYRALTDATPLPPRPAAGDIVRKRPPATPAPTTRPAAAPAAAPTPAPTTRPAAAGPKPARAAKAPAPKPAARPTTRPAATAKKPPESARPRRPVRPAPLVDVSAFRLSAIMVGPEGPTAIINGRFVSVGDRIGQATVTRITRSSVDLEIAGERITVGM
jgi:hypothetical protein